MNNIELQFEEYDPKKHGEMLENWRNDTGRFEKSVENYKKFGLLVDYPNINEMLSVYDPITTDQETLKILVFFNENKKDVGVAVIDHVTYENKKTTLSIFHIIIRPDEQGKKYGAYIMKQIIDNGEQIIGRRVDEVCASVDVNNDPSKKLMEKMGMTPLVQDGNYMIYAYSISRENERGNNEKNI